MRWGQVYALVVVILSLFRLGLSIGQMNIGDTTLVTLCGVVTCSNLFNSFVVLSKVSLGNFNLLAARVCIYKIIIRKVDLTHLADSCLNHCRLLGLSILRRLTQQLFVQNTSAHLV